MTERPILFSAPMVRALLDGTKTQTRRVMKGRYQEMGERDDGSMWPWSENPDTAADYWHACPYGQPGDRLWVRETFGYVSPDEHDRPHQECKIEYRADLPLGCTDRPGQWPVDECAGDPARPRWRPSIHMPRAASRLLLEITGVRVERLQAISDEDAIAEGIRRVGPGWERWHPDPADTEFTGSTQDPRLSYKGLWESINGAGSWGANLWVWVVEFKRVQP